MYTDKRCSSTNMWFKHSSISNTYNLCHVYWCPVSRSLTLSPKIAHHIIAQQSTTTTTHCKRILLLHLHTDKQNLTPPLSQYTYQKYISTINENNIISPHWPWILMRSEHLVSEDINDLGCRIFHQTHILGWGWLEIADVGNRTSGQLTCI